MKLRFWPLFWTLAVVLLVATLFAAVSFWRGGEELLEVTGGAKRPGVGTAGEADAEYVMVGGVPRRRSDLPQKEGAAGGREQDRNPDKGELDYGTTPLVPIDTNPQVAAVAKAIQEGRNPERYSSLIRPAAFDAKAYQQDPAAYINTPEPGRVFQPAQPGPEVKRIQRLSAYFQYVEQGQSVVLRAEALPGAPVTFTSFDLGRFENLLTTITVKANEQGAAEAEFFGTSGTIQDVNILAASPLTSGQLKYVVHVTLPREGQAGAEAE